MNSNKIKITGPHFINKHSLFYKHFYIFLFLILIFSQSFSQTQLLSSLRTNFNNYAEKWAQEKMYVHTNKSFYVAGEIIWLKIYDVDANFHKPIDVSKIAYIEIINKDLKPVLQGKISLKDGKGNGSFFLPFSLSSGNYKMRAYTNWMKNFSPNYYFEKDITIINTLKKLGADPVDEAQKYDIQFFPEGGNLVDGMESKIAFRVTDQNGKGVDCTGAIVDKNNNPIVRFQSQKFGIGNFMFTPVMDSQYRAVIKLNNSKAILTEIPEIHKYGYTLSLIDLDSDHIKATIRTNAKIDNPFIYLLVHTRQQLKLAEMLVLQNGEANFIIKKESLADGISTITLFNNNKQPVCERLYFKKPLSQLSLKLDTDLDEYGLRKKVNFNILAEDENKHPIGADLSMAVFLEDSLQTVDRMDITSYFWLCSELKGTIESPAYYFQNKGKEVDSDIDNLMLTHGWRRFKWEDILNSNAAPGFEFLPEYEGQIITGKITDKKTGLPIADLNTILSVPGDQFVLSTAVSNEEGKIQFDLKNFYGRNEVILQANNPSDTNYRIDISTPYSDKFSETKFPKLSLNETVAEPLLAHSINTQVENSYFSDNLQKFKIPAEALDTTAFFGKPDNGYLLDNYTRFTTMEEVMREIVKNIFVNKQRGRFHINMLSFPSDRFFDKDPLVLLDGVPFFDQNKIFALDPLKVKKVELMNRQFFLGPIDFNGIVSYTTFKGDLGGTQLDPNAVIIEYEGLQLEREFYSPVYDTPQKTQSRMPDARTVLYWSPDILTNKEGRKQLNFYTSDKQGKYIVFVQGTTADGRFGSQVLRFDVAK